jgi:alkyldihydroxyacetonephosphate synthase
MFIGSEGTLGVISRAWMRLQPRPKFRAGASVRFHSFFGAAHALRAIAQSGLYPSNCRILDAQEICLMADMECQSGRPLRWPDRSQ